MNPPRVLFVCVHNAGRSQMAAALLARHARGRVEARSAGSEPAAAVHPEVVLAMAEVGVDLSGERPKALTEDLLEAADVVVTMGCGDACPVSPGRRHEDWDLPDPAGRPIEEVRAIRDEIDRRVRSLLDRLLAGGEPPRHEERPTGENGGSERQEVRRMTVHRHEDTVHDHEHAHVVHYHRHGAEWVHLAASHRHEHNHPAVEHDHDPHEDAEKEHVREGHIHDHAHPAVS